MKTATCAVVGLVRGHADGNYSSLIRRNRCVARYLTKFPRPAADVILFPQGNITRAHQRHIVRKSGLSARFVSVRAHFPSWRGRCGPPGETVPIGYCHMCKFYFLVLPRLMQAMGYAYYMRLDDDSVLQRSRHNLFELVMAAGADYAPVWVGEEFHGPTRRTLPPAVAAYARRHRLRYRTTMAVAYNNFIVTRTAAWNEPRVRRFLETFGRSPRLYRPSARA